MEQKTETLSLDDIARVYRELDAKEKSFTIQKAMLITMARDASPDTTTWLKWARENCNVKRRQSFMLVKANGMLHRVQQCALYEDLKSMDVNKLEMLACIPDQDLPSFIAANDVVHMDRAELRAAIRAYMKKPARVRSIGYAALPEPEKLTLGLENPKALARLDLATEKSYVLAFHNRFEAVAIACQKSEENVKLIAELSRSLEQQARTFMQIAVGVQGDYRKCTPTKN